MVMNTVHATYTETYDLNTALNEISLIGIHTPQATALKSMFKGFFENYKKYKIVGCNVGMVCASTQSLTPDLVGLPGGTAPVDPRDVLNPILFKACTGEHLNEILNQIYHDNPSLSGSSLNQVKESNTLAINMYYQLLSDDTWRKEHPQRGLFINDLKPLVHKVVTTQPFRWTGSYASSEQYDLPMIDSNDGGSADSPYNFGGPSGLGLTSYNTNNSNPSVFISDGTTDMPWLDTTFDGKILGTDGETMVRCNRMIVSVPRVFCGCIILPPAIMQRLFFRCQIQWHVMFKDFRPAFEVGPLYGQGNLETIGGENYFDGSVLGTPGPNNPTYWEIYHDATTKLDKAYSSFDVNGGAEVEQVMESAN